MTENTSQMSDMLSVLALWIIILYLINFKYLIATYVISVFYTYADSVIGSWVSTLK
jgi:hypothetical protein